MNPLVLLIALELCWVNPTENVDGSTLTDLAEVTIYWEGQATGQVTYPRTDEGAQHCTDLTNLQPGLYQLTMTATDADGNESARSNMVEKTQEALPAAPWVIAPPEQVGGALEETTLLVGVTGTVVTLSWQGGAGETEIQLVEYGKDVPIREGRTSSTSWQFVPSASELYETRMRQCNPDCGPWTRSSEQGYLYYFKLAPASGGGVF